METWVEDLIQQMLSGKKYKRLIQKCIDHMEDGHKKLYKYYSFNSEYTLGNIEKATIFYSNPVTFNDPFDCNIGISVDQLFSALMPYFLNTANLSEKEIKFILSLIQTDEEAEMDRESKEAFIAECMGNEEVYSLIQQAQQGGEISNEQIVDIMIKYPDITKLILKYSATGVDSSDLDVNKLMDYLLRNPQIIKGIISNFPSIGEKEAGKYVEILASEDDFLIKVSRLAKLAGMEVPQNEINNLYYQLNGVVKQVHNSLGELIGISCFSETPTNLLMWSHYADKHSGICVEYDFSRLFSTVPNSLLLPVSYSTKRPLLRLDKIMCQENGKVILDKSRYAEIIPDVLKAIIIKGEIWSYEREWRHIIPINSLNNRTACLPIISRIITGINISDENREKIVELANRKHIPVSYARLRADSYKMEFSDHVSH